MPTASNDGVELHYEVDGPSDADTVVFVEGLGYGLWMWRWQNEALSDRFETIRWDNRGTGRSDVASASGGYTIEAMASDLEAVLADHGVERAHVVGASMGGMIAQQYAIDYERAVSLTLLCTTPGGDEALDTPEEVQEQITNVPDGYDERETLRHRMQPAVTDEFVEENEALVERILDWRVEGDANEAGRLAQLAAVGAFDASDRLDEIDRPTLILHGTADRVVPVENAELLADGIDDAECELFDGGPHLFFIEQAQAVNERIDAFLDTHARTQ